MKKHSFLLGVILLAQLTGMGTAAAAEAQVREDAPDRYEVVEGDTLWDIAGRFLAEPWLWPQVWEVNPQIENPHLIYPGDVILLSYENGVPVLSLERSGTSPAADAPSDLPVVELSPRVRREPLRSAVPAIPLDAVNAFLTAKRVVGSGELDETAYFVGTRNGTLLAGEGDVIFARGQWNDGVSTYEVVRPGSVFLDPDSGEEIGVEAEMIGEATLLSREEDRGVLQVANSTREIRAGDRLLPRETAVIDSTYFPEAPDFQVDARILEIGEGLAYGGENDTLILNVGERDAIAPGHLLTVQKPARVVEDPDTGDDLSFPGEKFGTVLVYRVFENTSLGLVLSSQGPIRMDDRLVTP